MLSFVSSQVDNCQLPFQNKVRRWACHLIQRFPIQWTHRIHFQIVVDAGMAECVTARSVQRLDKRLQANLAHQVLVHFVDVVVQMWFVMGMVLTALPANALLRLMRARAAATTTTTMMATRGRHRRGSLASRRSTSLHPVQPLLITTSNSPWFWTRRRFRNGNGRKGRLFLFCYLCTLLCKLWRQALSFSQDLFIRSIRSNVCFKFLDSSLPLKFTNSELNSIRNSFGSD